MLIEGEMGMGMIGGGGPSRMAGHAMIDEPMYLGGNPTR
jgi:hypothetical protein